MNEGNDDFDRFAFADLDASYAQQPPATVDEIYALLADAEKSKRRVLVHPSRVTEFEQAVRRAGLWAFVRVEAHALLPVSRAPWWRRVVNRLKRDGKNEDAGLVVFAQSEAEFEADTRSAMNRAVTESFEKLRAQTEAAPDLVRAYLDEVAKEELLREYLQRPKPQPGSPLLGPFGP